MEHGRDEQAEDVLGDIILAEDVLVWKNRVKKQATVIEEWRRKDMIMMAPVTQ